MPAFSLQSSNVFSYTFSGAGNTHFNCVQISNTAANPVLNLGGQSFTIECWLKPQNRGFNGSFASIFSKRRGAGSTNGTDISYIGYLDGAAGNISYYNGTNYISTARLTPNTWNHVAWVFNQSANVRIFVNGANVLTSTAVTAVNNIDSTFCIGNQPNHSDPGNQYFGDISNFRVIRGQAIYSGNFDISTYPIQLPNNAIGYHAGTANVAASLTGNVVLLTCNDDTLSVDGNSASVLSGNTFINGTVYPHLVDSLEMTEYSFHNLTQRDGVANTSRSFIVSTDSTNLNLPSGDFTLECWAYIVSGNGTIVNKGGGVNIAWPSFMISHGLGNVYFSGSNTNARMDIGGDGANGTGGNVHRGYIGTFSKNTWNHIAVSRSGTTYYGFLNGVLGYTETTANTPYNSTGRGLTILGYVENASNTWPAGVSFQNIAGYISNLRLVTGRALYTSNFTPQQSPLGFIPNTRLLTAKSSSLVDLAGSVTLAANGMGSIGISTFNPFTSNSITNANSTVGFSTNYSSGFELGRIYNKFDYSNFGQMINIYPALAQEPGRIYDKFSTAIFVSPAAPSAITIGQKLGRVYDKFSTNIFAFGTPIVVYTVGQDQGRIYAKQLSPSEFAYIPVGGGGGAGTGNVEYQFWS